MSEKGDEEDDSANASSWWGSFYDTAKRKLAETNEFMMRDMREFTDTVKSDTSKLVAATATSMKDQLNIKVDLNEASHATKVVTNTLSGFLGSVVSHVTPQPPSENENQDSTVYVGTAAGVKVFSPAEARLFAIQSDPGTYCNEPDNTAAFQVWDETFNLEEKREEISLLMLDCKEIRALYTKLVPDAVSHHNFWTRYFYKIDEFQKAEARRAQIVQRAEEKETELTWDDEDEVESETAHKSEEKTTEKVAQESDKVIQQSPSTQNNETTCTDATPEDAETLPETTADTATLEGDKAQEKPPQVPPDVATYKPEEDPVIPVQQTCTETTEHDIGPTGLIKEEKVSAPEKEVTTTSNVKPTPDVKTSTETAVKESSSGGSSDWEKEFDLEMTEDEIKEALLEDIENIDDEEVEGWEEWE